MDLDGTSTPVLSNISTGNMANMTDSPSSPWASVTHHDFFDDVTNLMTTSATPATSTEAELTLTERLFLLTAEEQQQAEDILLYVRYVTYVVSLPLTICNVVVFLHPAMRSATSSYIVVISLAQILYIVTNIIGRILNVAVPNRLNNFGYLVYSVYVSSYLSITLLRASYITMCYVCVERLYAVLRPFHIKEFILTRYPLRICAATFLFSIVYNIYNIVKSSIIQVKSSRTGKMVYIFKRTDLYYNNTEVIDTIGSLAPILMVYIPLMVLLVVNVLTIWALRRHNINTQRVQSSALSEEKRLQERQMTVTILATTVCYVILSLPYAFHTLFKNSLEDYDKRAKYNNLFYVMRAFGFTLTLVSFAVDFICFFFLSSTYRKTFLSIIRVSALRGSKFKNPTSQVESGPTLSSDAETRY